VIESVLEAQVESIGHHISTILNGSMAGINNIQNQLMLRNSRHLTGTGWGPHTQIEELNISARDIEFFHNGQRISMDHAQRFLSRTDLETYVALNSAPFGPSIQRITFRDGRDELLNTDTVFSVDGAGGFQIASINGTITTDAGTIVRRYGRLVTGTDIMVGDTLRVSLNGGNHAAVVDIFERPGATAVSIARARIQSVDTGRSFTVQSMSTLVGNEWMFTPVERVFTITPNTLFLNEFGFVDPNLFIDFTSESVRDRTFTIIYDGAVATHVIDAPFSNRAVRGMIVGLGASEYGPSLLIRDAQYLDNAPTPNNEPGPSHQWNNISRTDPTMNILYSPNTIVIRNNRVAQVSDLQPGDHIRVLTRNLPPMASGADVWGYIILVER
jgi:hypothetical protein